MFICGGAELSAGAEGVCFIIVVIFCGVDGFGGIQMAHALLWSQLRTVVFVFTGLNFCNYGPHTHTLSHTGILRPDE